MDTSVLLSFVCSNNEDFLLRFAQGSPLYVPEAIDKEMERKLAEKRFNHGQKKWRILKDSQYLTVLEDNNEALLEIVRKWAGPRYSIQHGLAKNLGEYIGLAHCIFRQQVNKKMKSEEKVAIVLDDGASRELARKRGVPSFSSEQVLLRAVGLGHLTTREAVKKVWNQLRQYDEHVPFERTIPADKKYYQNDR